MNARNAWLSRLALVVGMLVGSPTSSVLAGELPIEDLPLHDEQITPVKVGEFAAERLRVFSTADGLPSDEVNAVSLSPQGAAIAGTTRGLATWNGDRWEACLNRPNKVLALLRHGDSILVAIGNELVQWTPGTGAAATLASLPPEFANASRASLAVAVDTIYLGGDEGLFALIDGQFRPVGSYLELVGDHRAVRQLAAAPNGELTVAATDGLLSRAAAGNWHAVRARAGKRSWYPHDVRGVTYDRAGRLWFASSQGVGCRTGDQWALYTGDEGLPYDDFTACAAGEPGVVWFGTKIGAIRFDGSSWNYRQGRRWTPDDVINAVAVDEHGNAWMATNQGVGLIERQATTLAKKAAFFEEEIDRHHRRTPFGFVNAVGASTPGSKEGVQQFDSDNDGLWTAMYGAGQCFAYAATKDPEAKKRAVAAFEALKFLSDVTQGGSHPAPKGFPARSIRPVTGPNPNDYDNLERDRAVRGAEDEHWKEISPRWPVSADGQWYWKCDTSSDELDGHYFLYANYYDLVAETAEEKARVRQVVYDMTTHLIDHDYQLVDHDGEPTRWGRYNRETLDHGNLIAGRGLNSLSILSYLKTAEHITGDPKFRQHHDQLVKEHSYAANTFNPKWSLGYGTGNQSDDEMAFMCYYNLLRYETDPAVRKFYEYSLSWYWSLERPECNPLFNFVFAAVWDGAMGYPVRSIPQHALDDAVDTLKRFPLDRFNWAHKNSHRIDVVPLRDRWFQNTGHRIDGKVIPVDERYFEFWNHNPWQLDVGGSGSELADGAAFLLPYYLGRYHGFIEE
ncbi:MAG: hypothetical protein JNL18_18755 [Planctomycetaceae bacterium]|nr:hypothetical protein [Planctomycetaceae bacterium]